MTIKHLKLSNEHTNNFKQLLYKTSLCCYNCYSNDTHYTLDIYFTKNWRQNLYIKKFAVKNYKTNFFLYCRVGRGNLVSSYTVPHVSSNFQKNFIAHWVPQLYTALRLPEKLQSNSVILRNNSLSNKNENNYFNVKKIATSSDKPFGSRSLKIPFYHHVFK